MPNKCYLQTVHIRRVQTIGKVLRTGILRTVYLYTAANTSHKFCSIVRLYAETLVTKCRHERGNELAISIFNTFIDALVEERAVNSEVSIMCQALTVLFECKYKSSDTWLKMYRDPTFTRLCMRTTNDILRSMDTFSVKRISIVHLYLRLVSTVKELEQFASSFGGKEKRFDERAARIMFSVVMDSEDTFMALGIMNHMAFIHSKLRKRKVPNGKSNQLHPIKDLVDLWAPRVTDIWRAYHGRDGRLPFRIDSVWCNPFLRTLVPKEWLLSAVAQREKSK